MFRLFAYVQYLLRSFHLHGIHSPFVFEFQEQFLNEKTPYYSFDEIESIRAKLLLTEKAIQVEDLGAGSKRLNQAKRKIKSIAKTSLKPAKYAQLLYRIAYAAKAENTVEIGTSLGITTAYFSKATPKSKVYTLEGAAEIAKIAQINFSKLNCQNIELIEGNFNSTLAKLLSQLNHVGLVYFDGNHQEEATLNYFYACLEKSNENSIFIFDDIYWSAGMQRAWKKIKQEPRVTVTIDLYELGIVFFKTDQQKQDFTIYH